MAPVRVKVCNPTAVGLSRAHLFLYSPDLYTSWSKSMGLDTSQYQFTDIYGLDEDLLAFVPQPVKAVSYLEPLYLLCYSAL